MDFRKTPSTLLDTVTLAHGSIIRPYWVNTCGLKWLKERLEGTSNRAWKKTKKVDILRCLGVYWVCVKDCRDRRKRFGREFDLGYRDFRWHPGHPSLLTPQLFTYHEVRHYFTQLFAYPLLLYQCEPHNGRKLICLAPGIHGFISTFGIDCGMLGPLYI